MVNFTEHMLTCACMHASVHIHMHTHVVFCFSGTHWGKYQLITSLFHCTELTSIPPDLYKHLAMRSIWFYYSYMSYFLCLRCNGASLISTEKTYDISITLVCSVPALQLPSIYFSNLNQILYLNNNLVEEITKCQLPLFVQMATHKQSNNKNTNNTLHPIKILR